MRTVYLTREKSFVACLGSLNVYIEDNENSEITINDVPCRKVARIKNGETVSFDAPEHEVKIFVIADKLSKNLCNDFYRLGAGNVDVELSGKCAYNPFIGNPFRFDGVLDEEALASRKKSGKKGIILLVCSLLVGFIIGFALNYNLFFPEDKTFECSEFDITLTDEFAFKTESGSYVFNSHECSIVVVKNNFGALTEDQLIEYFKATDAFGENATFSRRESLCLIEQSTLSDDGTAINHFIVLMMNEKNNDIFLFEFRCEAEDYEKLSEDFVKWAKSVKLK